MAYYADYFNNYTEREIYDEAYYSRQFAFPSYYPPRCHYGNCTRLRFAPIDGVPIAERGPIRINQRRIVAPQLFVTSVIPYSKIRMLP